MIDKQTALELAIRADLHRGLEQFGQIVTNVDKLIEGAKKIENYINGEAKNENI